MKWCCTVNRLSGFYVVEIVAINGWNKGISMEANTCPNSAIETLEKFVKYVPS